MSVITRTPSSAARLIAVNLAILALGVFVLEVIFGNWFSPNRMNRLHIPRDAVRLSDVGALYPSPDRFVRYTRDAHGFRGTYPSVDRIDILTVGGSATDQRYIADGHTWQDVLAKTFSENGRRVSVVNAGIDGQSTYGHVKNFEWWFPYIPQFKTKYFLFYIGLNDLYKDDGYAGDRLVKPSSAIKALLEQNSAAYQVFRTLHGMYRAAMVAKLGHRRTKFSELGWTTAPLLQDHEEPVLRRLQAYRARLITLGKKVEQQGSGLICVTQASRAYKKVNGSILGVTPLGSLGDTVINGVDYYHMLQRFHRTTVQTCRELGGLPIDLANEVEWDDHDFYDFAHNTPRGAEKLGRYLYTKLRDVP